MVTLQTAGVPVSCSTGIPALGSAVGWAVLQVTHLSLLLVVELVVLRTPPAQVVGLGLCL